MRVRVAQDQDDYAACRALASESDETLGDMVFPTVMIYDEESDDSLIGFLATTPKPDMVLAGPLVMKSDRPRPFALFKLATAYDQALFSMGITSYVFWVDADGPFKRFVEENLGISPYASDGNKLFYLRKLENGRR